MRASTRLEEKYLLMDDNALAAGVALRKAELGKRLCILAHHYQRDEIVRFADFVGDSLRLSQQAAELKAEFVVFCGVHFMAESADILARHGQAIILPDLAAGCSMAEMATAEDMQDALDAIAAAAPGARVVPVSYVNSTAAVKAVTGRAGGACCTSSNARKVFEWALAPADAGGAAGQKILALPDQHLARNTALAMGYTLADCVVYDPAKGNGGLSDEQLRAAKFILWKGHCYVHQHFSVERIRQLRREIPGVQVIVHPECPYEVVAEAGQSGSTEQILRVVNASPAGSRWAVGTEINMVRRLARANPDKRILPLSESPALCTMMDRIDLRRLLWVLDELAGGRVVNRIQVRPEVAQDARIALERMLTHT